MSRNERDRAYLVFNGREIIGEIKPSSTLLETLELTPRTVVREILEVVFSANKYQHIQPPIAAAHIPGAGQLIRATYAVQEMIESNWMEQLEETSEIARRAREDIAALRQLLYSIWTLISDELIYLIEAFKLSDSEIRDLRFERWIDEDFIVSIPSRRRK